MTTCLGKDLFFGFFCMSFINILSICVFTSFTFGLEGEIWDLLVIIPDHWLSFYFDFEISRVDCI